MAILELEPEDRVTRAQHDDSAEANHRIANNLALVSALVRMQASAISRKGETLTAEETSHALLEAAARIENIARLHRLLMQDSELAPGPYLADICDRVSGSLSASCTVSYKDESGSARLAPERLNPLGLFLTEALTNAFKHSHPAGAPGKVDVVFRRRGPYLELEIRDDGVGLPEDFNPLTDGGLGFRIMRSLATQMDAKVSFPVSPFGVSILVSAPVAVAVSVR